MWIWNNFILKRCAQYLENWQLFVTRETVRKKKEFIGEKNNNWQLFVMRER